MTLANSLGGYLLLGLVVCLLVCLWAHEQPNPRHIILITFWPLYTVLGVLVALMIACTYILGLTAGTLEFIESVWESCAIGYQHWNDNDNQPS